MCRCNNRFRRTGDQHKSECHDTAFHRNIGCRPCASSYFADSDSSASPVSFAQSFVEAATNPLLLSLPAYRLLATLSMRLQPSNLRKLNLWVFILFLLLIFPLNKLYPKWFGT